MGMFDYVNFEMPCPNCGTLLTGFQSKDAECKMDKIEPDGIGNFYARCKCGHWVEFSRTRPAGHMPREKPLTREEVEAMGFVMHGQAPNAGHFGIDALVGPELWGIRNKAAGSRVHVQCYRDKTQAELAAGKRTDNYSEFEVVPLFLTPNSGG